MPADRIVVVGASIGGVRCAQALRSGGHTGEIVLLSAEDVAPYDKPPLSKEALTTEHEPAALLRPADDLDLRYNAPATALDPAAKTVTINDGERIGYDKIVLATGVRPRTLPGDQVITIRELRDSTALRTRLASKGPVVVIGGGFIGAEVAASAATLGCPVTIVEALPAPFSRVLGPEVGALLTELHTENGVSVIAGVSVTKIADTVHLSDGRQLAAETVVAGIGCVPNTEWLAGSGLPVDNGIRVDQHGKAADDVYALGDVANWTGPDGVARRVEHWTSAVEQAGIVAHNLRNPAEQRPHTAPPYFWSDQHGVKLQMVGRVGPQDTVHIAQLNNRKVAVYQRKTGEFAAAVTFGWPRASVAARQAWERGATAAEFLTKLDELSSANTEKSGVRR
jgi:NADPH-dependent 2,4-dienoyl-CoA reductase/sulfur reductase-like enzyme